MADKDPQGWISKNKNMDLSVGFLFFVCAPQTRISLSVQLPCCPCVRKPIWSGCFNRAFYFLWGWLCCQTFPSLCFVWPPLCCETSGCTYPAQFSLPSSFAWVQNRLAGGEMCRRIENNLFFFFAAWIIWKSKHGTGVIDTHSLSVRYLYTHRVIQTDPVNTHYRISAY